MPRRLAAALHLFGLAALAFAEPLFSLLSRQAEFLIAHDARPLDLVLMALVLSVGLPASLVLTVRAVAWLSRPAGHRVQLALVTGLSGLIALQLIKRLAPEAPGWTLIAAAAAIALAAGACYRRSHAARTFLAFISPVALLSPALFLFTSPVRQMLWPHAGGRIVPVAGVPAAGAPVVMVVLDELPLSSLLDGSGAIDPLRYPNLATLAGDAYWFRDATTVSRMTNYSLPIILSGRLPEHSRPPMASNYPDNLFTWLAGAGYELNVFETQTRICPRRLCSREVTRRSSSERLDAMATDLAIIYLHLLSPADFAARLPVIDATWRGFSQRTIGARVRQLLGARPRGPAVKRRDNPWLFDAFLDGIGSSDRTALHFIHLMLPHVPWKYLPSGKEYGRVGAPILPHGLIKDIWSTQEWQVVQGFQRHLLQVGYVDFLIGRLLARLKLRDLYDPALIILVADHGAAFRPGKPRRGFAGGRFADILNVPLIVKLPGQRQGVLSERNVETVDILPAVAEVLGRELPWPADGRSAIDAEAPERRRKRFLVSVRGGGFELRSLSLEALRSDRRQNVKRKLNLFGSGTRRDGLFRIGRRTDLLGRRPPEIGIASTPAAGTPASGEKVLRVELDQAWVYDQVDPDSPFVPAQVTGRVRFSRRRDTPVELAIVVNGTVEAVTQTFDHERGGARFTAMVREEALRAGRNRIEVFEIRGGDEATVLVSVRQLGARFTLVTGSGGVVIRSADGLVLPRVKGHLRGAARLQVGEIGTVLLGWTMAGTGDRPAERLLVFVDGRLALATGSAESAFRIQLPDAVVTGGQEVRLFAIAGDRASEIAVRWPKP